MTLLEKLDALKAKTGDSNASLARNSGIPYTTIDGLYKKGYSNMKLSTLQALCDYFNVPIDYLAKDDDENTENKKPANDGGQSLHDELVMLFSQLSDDDQELMLLLLKALLRRRQ